MGTGKEKQGETFIVKKFYTPDITVKVNGVSYSYNITPFPWLHPYAESCPLFTLRKEVEDSCKAGFSDGLQRVL